MPDEMTEGEKAFLFFRHWQTRLGFGSAWLCFDGLTVRYEWRPLRGYIFTEKYDAAHLATLPKDFIWAMAYATADRMREEYRKLATPRALASLTNHKDPRCRASTNH